MSAGEADGRDRLAALGRRLGLSSGETGALLALYDATPAAERQLRRFVGLLAHYQRYVRWRTDLARYGRGAVQ